MLAATTVPTPLTTGSVPQVLAITSNGSILAGLLSGTVEVHSLATNARKLTSISAGTGSVRTILSCGEDMACCALSEGLVTLLDLGKGEVKCSWNTTDKDLAPTALLGFTNGSQIGYVGDESGGLSHVDMRTPDALVHTLEHGDYVSDLAFVSGNADRILAASGDGTLGLYDARAGRVKLFGLSETFDDDLLCLAVDDSGIVVGGTLEGAVHRFDCGQLANAEVGAEGISLDVARLRGHPDSVNTLLTRSGAVVTGCSDGLVRVVEPAEGKLLGVLQFDRSWAQSDDKQVVEKWPIEAIAVAKDGDGKDVLALVGHEECIRFASLSLLDESDDEDEEEVEKEAPREEKKKGGKKKRAKKGRGGSETKRQKGPDSFFGDL